MKIWGRRGAIAVLGWTAIGAVFALPQLWRGNGYAPALAIMVNWWLWGALAPLAIAADTRMAVLFRRGLPLLAARLGFALLLAALYVAVAATLAYRLGLNAWDPLSAPEGLIDWYVWALYVYGLILGTWKLYCYARLHQVDELKLARLERQVLETRLDALRTQLDPRLVFEALNGIAAEVEAQPRLARRMIEHLGDLLRLSLAMRTRQHVSLAEEIAFLKHTIALHRLRHGKGLRVTLSIAPETRAARIPALLLQPLVDNAIRHGIGAGGGRIDIAARRSGERLEIRVSDDGPGLPRGWPMAGAQRDEPGQGLRVTQQRLLAMFPPQDCALVVGARAGGGAEAVISLPYNLPSEDAHARAVA